MYKSHCTLHISCLSFVGYCTVVAAAHGQQALDLIDRGLRPTVVVCDVMMPGAGLRLSI